MVLEFASQRKPISGLESVEFPGVSVSWRLGYAGGFYDEKKSLVEMDGKMSAFCFEEDFKILL